MNEIGLQQPVAAKSRASAPDRQTGPASATTDTKVSVSVTQAEARQTEAKEQQSVLEQQQQRKEQGKEDANVQRAVSKLNDYVQNTERKLEFQVDKDSGETVVRVFDKSSDKLIRQIPNEEALELAKRLNQEEPLMLFSAQV